MYKLYKFSFGKIIYFLRSQNNKFINILNIETDY